MRAITLSVAALATLALVGLDTNAAQAAHGSGGVGIHIGGRNVHLDVGNPHGYGYGRQVAYRSARTYYPQQRTRAHYDWHDTSHYDYHPGGYVRHGNHLDYRPGHYDLHKEGHYDLHNGSHRGGRH
jgi:hypothetical protein